jgi:hypothetical protein
VAAINAHSGDAVMLREGSKALYTMGVHDGSVRLAIGRAGSIEALVASHCSCSDAYAAVWTANIGRVLFMLMQEADNRRIFNSVKARACESGTWRTVLDAFVH